MHLLVLSAFRQHAQRYGVRLQNPVSMHLLVLSAFRQQHRRAVHNLFGLNAPSGAQCFPTFLLGWGYECEWPQLSQCTFWCSVLSDLKRKHMSMESM